MTQTVAIAVKTIDRSPKGKRNYLGETLENLKRGGVFASKHLHSLTLVDGGTENVVRYIREQVGEPIEVNSFPGKPRCFEVCRHGQDWLNRDIYVEAPPYGSRRTYHRNAQRALELAGQAGADWAMVIEDDIDVCAHFLESAVQWLSEHEEPGPMLYALGANYQQIRQVREAGGTVWPYPCNAFYGALCCVWRPADALDVVQWYGHDPAYIHEDGSRVYDAGHDLMLGRWGQDRGLTHFMASVPCFIDHIGLESGLGNRPIQYAGFGGRHYSYVRREEVA